MPLSAGPFVASFANEIAMFNDNRVDDDDIEWIFATESIVGEFDCFAMGHLLAEDAHHERYSTHRV